MEIAPTLHPRHERVNAYARGSSISPTTAPTYAGPQHRRIELLLPDLSELLAIDAG